MKPNYTVHKICSNGKNSFNIIESDSQLSLRIFADGEPSSRYITLRIKNNRLNIYDIQYKVFGSNVRTIRTISFRYDIISKFVKDMVCVCSPVLAKNRLYLVRKAKVSKVNKIIQNFACKKLGIKLVKSTLPTNDVIQNLMFPFMCFRTEPSFAIKKAKHCKDWHEALDKMIGKKRPKKLNRIIYKHIEEKNGYVINNVICNYLRFKGILDINHIYKIMIDLYINTDRNIKNSDVRKFLRCVKPTIFIKKFATFDFTDSMRMWKKIYDKNIKIDISKFNSIKEVHDFLFIESYKIENADFDLKQNSLLVVDGVTVDDLTIVVPKTNYELLEWGKNIMGNCVGTYGDRVSRGLTKILGVLYKGKLTYNIEIVNNEVRQFYAAYNKSADQKHKDLIIKELIKYNIAREAPYRNYLGQDNQACVDDLLF